MYFNFKNYTFYGTNCNDLSLIGSICVKLERITFLWDIYFFEYSFDDYLKRSTKVFVHVMERGIPLITTSG